jgi:hypothetical protein
VRADAGRSSVDDSFRDRFLLAAEALRAYLAVAVDDLNTIEAVKDYLNESYDHAIDLREPLPVALAEPGPLIARVVRLAGPNGITRQRLFDIFYLLGTDRVERGLETMLAGGAVRGDIEERTSAVGRVQRQTVYR